MQQKRGFRSNEGGGVYVTLQIITLCQSPLYFLYFSLLTGLGTPYWGYRPEVTASRSLRPLIIAVSSRMSCSSAHGGYLGSWRLSLLRVAFTNSCSVAVRSVHRQATIPHIDRPFLFGWLFLMRGCFRAAYNTRCLSVIHMDAHLQKTPPASR